jgi:tetratricopeptide (TPR) repeat protein
MSAAMPRMRWRVGRLGFGFGAGLGLVLVAFAAGGYFPTTWAWGALIALTVIAAYLVVGDAARPSVLALVSLGGLVGFAAWTWLALLWSEVPAATVLEGLRLLMYVSVYAALVLIVRRAALEVVLWAGFVAVFLASGYGLLTRLFPERLGVFDPIAEGRLAEPLTYSNAMGLFAAMGMLLGLGFAARAKDAFARALAGATLPLLAVTVYFTFSRGAWVAAAIGFAIAVAIDPRRLQFVFAALVLAPLSTIAVLVASRQPALSRTDALLSAASKEGHRLAVYLLVLAAASALVALCLALAEQRVAPPRPVRLAFGGVLVVAAVACLLATFVRYGGPITIGQKGYDAFTTTGGPDPVDLNEHLVSFSGTHRPQIWHEAWRDYRAHPVLGSGPGTFEQYWNKHRPIKLKLRDAHSLYLEVLAELGPVGLLLLLVALGTPFAAAILARGHPLVPGVLAAYAAYLARAGIDWDWEMGALTLLALACAAVLLVAADKRDDVRPTLSPVARIGSVSVAVILLVPAFIGLAGASALDASDGALAKGHYAAAASQARKAARWWRWSPQPWQKLGEAQAQQGDYVGAQSSFRKAISKDGRDWTIWYDLSTVTSGRASARALREVSRLNPRYETDLG